MRTGSKRRVTGFVAIAAASVLAAGACSTGGGGEQSQKNVSPGFSECDKKPNDCNSGPTKKGGTYVQALEKTIPNWNVQDADGNVFDTSQVMNGLLPSPFIVYPDLTPHLNEDMMTSAEVTSQDPYTVVYKVRPEAVWSDGTPMGYDDFLYEWKTQNGKDCPACTPATTTGYDLISGIEQADNGKTITVKFSKPYPDWKSLFTLYPAGVAKQAAGGDLNTPAALKKAFEAFKATTPNWSGAAYKIGDYQKDASVTLVPNDKWYGKTKPSLEKIVFRIITDQAQEVPALQNKEVNGVYAQPNQDMVEKVKGITDVNYMLGKGLVWEHIDLNLKNKYLSDMALRQAIFTAINTKDLIGKTVGQFVPGAEPLGSHNYVPGQPGYKDFVTPTGQGSGDVEKAKQILTDAGYKIDNGKLMTKTGEAVPAFRFRFTEGNQLRQQSGEIVQNALKQLGISVTLQPTSTLGGTLTNGDFDMIIYAWVSTPFASGNKDLWITNGGGNYGKWSNKEADGYLEEAATATDEAKVAELLNKADEIMTKEAYVLPLFQKPTFLAVYKDYVNIRDNATSTGPSYNIHEWGLKASAQ